MTNLVNSKNFIRNFILILAISLSSCSLPDYFKGDQTPKIRIVDLQGKSHSVKTKFPRLNVQALANQAQLSSNSVQNSLQDINEAQNQSNLEQNDPVNNALEQTLQTPQEPIASRNPRGLEPAVNEKAVSNFAKNIDKRQEVEYDLANDQQNIEIIEIEPEDLSDKIKDKPKKVVKKKSKAKSLKTVNNYSRQKGWFVQVGSFSSSSNAKNSLRKMSKFHDGYVEKIKRQKTLYRVLLGPFSSKKTAKKLLSKVKKSGHDAVLRRNR